MLPFFAQIMQLFARLSAGHFGTFGFGVFLEEEVSLGSLVKLCGEDRTGKSALLHHMAVQCVLPKQVPGGGGGKVAFVTTNCGVNVHMMCPCSPSDCSAFTKCKVCWWSMSAFINFT